MATLPSLRPNEPVTNVSITVVGDATAWQAIEDDPDSPNLDDYCYDAGATNGDLIVGLTNMPANFSAMGGTLTVRAITQALGFTDDLDVLSVRLTDSAGTALSNTVTLSTQADTTQALRTAALTINATGLAASKAVWDDARLALLWTYTADMAKDNGVIRVYALEVDGSYTPTPNAATAAQTLPALTQVASATFLYGHIGTAAQSLPALTQAAVAEHQVFGSGSPVETISVTAVGGELVTVGWGFVPI